MATVLGNETHLLKSAIIEIRQRGRALASTAATDEDEEHNEQQQQSPTQACQQQQGDNEPVPVSVRT